MAGTLLIPPLQVNVPSNEQLEDLLCSKGLKGNDQGSKVHFWPTHDTD